MITLSIFSILLTVSFGAFVYVATSYVTPRLIRNVQIKTRSGVFNHKLNY